jgi:hypothetical protein
MNLLESNKFKFKLKWITSYGILTNVNWVIDYNVQYFTLSQLLYDVKSGHSVEWNSSGLAETPDDGRLGPKHVVKGSSDRHSCSIAGIILCIKDILMQQDALVEYWILLQNGLTRGLVQDLLLGVCGHRRVVIP